MLASSIVNYGIPAVLIVTLSLSLFFYRRRSASSRNAAVPPLAPTSSTPPASAPPIDSTLFAGSNESSSTVSPAELVAEETAAVAVAESGTFELATSDGSASGGAADEEEEEEAAGATVRERTGRTRSLFANAFASIRGKGKVDASTWDELEETLLRADIGIGLTTKLLERSLHMNAAVKPNVWLFVGVNGVGKTTTIGKIATAEIARGTSVLLAAGDTFRAAAAEQLQVWAERSGASFVRGSEGGDPASVIFDGIQSAHAKNIDVVLGDTAGRLQNKTNLMEELKKVRRVAEKAEGTVNEVLLVIDATTGQNGLSQAREFAAATDVTGVVLTKLDGSAKGGIVFAIETELGIPVKLVGLGEGAHDLVAFNPEEYVAALFE
jgi:fused signal recognition particle receptor